jgi:hypothetical protein
LSIVDLLAIEQSNGKDSVGHHWLLANLVGTGTWNFNAPESADSITISGSEGQLTTAVRADTDVVVVRGGQQNVYRFRNPPHVHQPLIQTIVDELRGRGRCESTGESGARASWVMDRCVEGYYRRQN